MENREGDEWTGRMNTEPDMSVGAKMIDKQLAVDTVYLDHYRESSRISSQEIIREFREVASAEALGNLTATSEKNIVEVTGGPKSTERQNVEEDENWTAYCDVSLR